MRPETPLAVENGVGKLAANWRLMSAWEREPGELPSPISSPSSRKAGRGHLLLRGFVRQRKKTCPGSNLSATMGGQQSGFHTERALWVEFIMISLKP